MAYTLLGNGAGSKRKTSRTSPRRPPSKPPPQGCWILPFWRNCRKRLLEQRTSNRLVDGLMGVVVKLPYCWVFKEVIGGLLKVWTG